MGTKWGFPTNSPKGVSLDEGTKWGFSVNTLKKASRWKGQVSSEGIKQGFLIKGPNRGFSEKAPNGNFPDTTPLIITNCGGSQLYTASRKWFFHRTIHYTGCVRISTGHFVSTNSIASTYLTHWRIVTRKPIKLHWFRSLHLKHSNSQVCECIFEERTKFSLRSPYILTPYVVKT